MSTSGLIKELAYYLSTVLDNQEYLKYSNEKSRLSHYKHNKLIELFVVDSTERMAATAIGYLIKIW